MASMLKIRDENGNIIDIPALRGKQGDKGVGIQSIDKTSTNGLVDTYTITMTDGSTSEFTVTNGSSGVTPDGDEVMLPTVDPTLTLEGYSADAKAVGERLEAVEYQTVTTDFKSSHKDLPEIEKTVVFETNGVWGDKAYINYGIDLIPRGGFDKVFPWMGITIMQKGDIFKITGHPTGNTTGAYLTQDGGDNYYVELPDGLIGKTLNILGFSNRLYQQCRVDVCFYDSNKTQLLKKPCYLARATMLNASVVVPNDTVYYSVNIQVSGQDPEYDLEAKIYLLVADDVEEVSLSESTTKEGVTSTSFSTMPYESSLSYEVTLNEYISNFAGGGTVSYLTPEDFGAVGDGSADDSEAIALCLEQANISKQTVLMAGKYYVTMPIDIKASGLNILANDIVYDRTDTAIKISGQNNTLKIHSINSGGVGIGYRADNGKAVFYNDVDINTINAVSHGIIFYNGLKGIYQNTVRFNRIKAGGTGCYGIGIIDIEGDSYINTNNFYGGHISDCEWAVYKVGTNSKFYGIHAELRVEGGFYIEQGAVIFYPKIAESQRDGALPIFKFEDPRHSAIHSIDGIQINEIDLSEAPKTVTAESGDIFPIMESLCGVIYAPIVASNINVAENRKESCVYTTKSYLWGRHLIMTPDRQYRKVVTTETLDTRLIGKETTHEEIRELCGLPTKFVVDNINTEIYLHASYCTLGFNEFEVEQTNGFTCKVYDFYGTLIFDGTNTGDGIYKFKVYKDSETAKDMFGSNGCDFSKQCWNIEKLLTENDTYTKASIDEALGTYITDVANIVGGDA